MNPLNEKNTAFQLFCAVDEMRRAWRAVTPCKTLSKSQFATLMFIAHGGDPLSTACETRPVQPMPLTVLANLQEQSLPAISQRVSALEQMGYLERVPTPNDRRVSAVQLTPQGKAFLKETRAQMQRKMQAALQEMTQEELTTLLTLMAKLTSALEQAADLQKMEDAVCTN